ncbi:MAG: arsenic resistance N-acetyltransferase ArsN2 [Candidatus Thorarchaeota archaeon]|jgi:amino-acid N-acetyltransferase
MIDGTNGIRAARAEDLENVLELLQLVDLPTEEVETHFENFIVLYDSSSDSIQGCAGLEVFEDGVLLRSVAIRPDYQGRGIGTKLVKAAIQKAKDLQVSELFLLTDTAERFFEKLGFSVVDRERVPPDVKTSIEFTELCTEAPSMRYDLGQ